MNRTLRTLAVVGAMCLASGPAAPQVPPGIGTEEFGMTPKRLVEAVDKVESAIARCMREQGFEYVAADYHTVRRGMNADKMLPGMSVKEFFAKHGFGVSTLYSGEPPQLAKGYSPGREGLGERNIAIFSKLSNEDRVAYNRALLGENPGATFAVSLEKENFAPTGGCTRKAVAQVFGAAEMSASYYNPKDALINKDPRMKEAVRKYAAEMRRAGFDYSHPDEVEADIQKRLDAITRGGTIAVAQLTPAQRSALKELQSHEMAVAQKHRQLVDTVVDPVADKIEEQIFSRKPQ